MKYLVSSSAVLRFADGTQVELVPGIYSFDKNISDHWAFGAHAKAVDDSELERLNSDADLNLKVSVLEGEITDLKAQVVTKDVEITDLKAQVVVLTNAQTSAQPEEAKAEEAQPDAEQETGNAKKQSSSNK